MPPSVTDDERRSVSSGSYVHASQMAGSTIEGGASATKPKKSKAQLWQEMKINSITRALALTYILSLLALLTRIQLNLLGRRTYLSSVVAMASPQAAQQSSTISLENKDDDNWDNIYGNDFDTNRKYLMFSWWLLHRGSKQILERVMAAVKEVFGQVNIREDMSLERLAELIMDVRKKIEGATEEERQNMRWLSYLLPPDGQEAYVIQQAGSSDSGDSPSPPAAHSSNPMDAPPVNDSLRRLLDETSDLIDSPTFSIVLTHLLDAAYSHLVDYHIATEAFQSTGPSAPGVGMNVQGMSAYADSESRVTEISDTKCKLAHILPVFVRQAHVISHGSGELDPTGSGEAATENEYLSAIDGVRDLEAFAAVIYSSNFEQEVAERVEAGKGTTSRASDRQTAAMMEEGPARRPSTANLPGQMDQVEDMQSPVAVDSPLNEHGAGLTENAAQESAPAGAEASAGGGFETAWKRALAAEDGQQAPEERE